MDKKTTERETRDFMSVESFSQLPFIRSAPPLPRENAAAGAIRLFGKDFGNCKTNTDADDQSDSNDNDAQEADQVNKDNSTETSSRKFECHYCCRNFPTSQALGGHQNAHKRERQQAKRAHLHSTMLHGTSADPHVYGLINYARLASAPSLPLPYHSWTGGAGNAYSAATTTSRIYGGYASFTAHPQPINGSPLAYWRLPATHNSAARDRPPPQLMFGSKDEFKPLASAASQLRFPYEVKHEHVSLDLHL